MTDYISREAALDALCKASTPCFSSTGKPILVFDVDYVPAINSIPAADVRPVESIGLARTMNEAADAIEELSKRVPPVPHGRLIDADALIKEMDKQENAMYEHGREFSFSFESGGDVCTAWYNVEMMVEDAPTIIPASEEDET